MIDNSLLKPVKRHIDMLAGRNAGPASAPHQG